eukprot:9344748-Ditylum_brightwellii.AAC.1
MGTAKQSISDFIKSLKKCGENFEFTEEGDVENYLGIMIRRSGKKQSWNYKSAVGMSSYIQGSSRPETSMTVQQYARFTNAPMISHERAIRRIAKYLAGTADRSVVYNLDPERDIEYYVDADFAGGWSKADADNPEM